MGRTQIEWADMVWNPVTGCSKVSPGCRNCYAERFAKRMAGRCGYPADAPFRVTLREDRLEQPWMHGPRRVVFVNSMSDLFHEAVPDEFIARVFLAMFRAPQHTYLVLTKRPERMLEWATRAVLPCWDCAWTGDRGACTTCYGTGRRPWRDDPCPWIWLGVSAENQEYADQRIPLLLRTPAAHRFVSLEPLLGPVRLRDEWLPRWDRLSETSPSGRLMYRCRRCWMETPAPTRRCDAGCSDERTLQWVIVGGETGPGARPMHPAWVRQIRDQCVGAGVPFWFKQWGEWSPIGKDEVRYTRSRVLYLNASGAQRFADPPDPAFIEAADTVAMARVGRRRAGRVLDGCIWEGRPFAGWYEVPPRRKRQRSRSTGREGGDRVPASCATAGEHS